MIVTYEKVIRLKDLTNCIGQVLAFTKVDGEVLLALLSEQSFSEEGYILIAPHICLETAGSDRMHKRISVEAASTKTNDRGITKYTAALNVVVFADVEFIGYKPRYLIFPSINGIAHDVIPTNGLIVKLFKTSFTPRMSKG